MKKFLKTAAVFAALVLALACFAGCKNNSDGSGDSVKTLSDEWIAPVKGGSLKFSFYDDNTFEYKEKVGAKSGEISGTYAIANTRAVAYGKYILTIKTISGEFSYATDLEEGGTMTVSFSEDKGLSVEEIEIKTGFEPQAPQTSEENFDAGPCTDVTNPDDLVGTWRSVVIRFDEFGEGEYGDEYGNIYMAIADAKGITDWQISKDGENYICKVIYKAGSYLGAIDFYDPPLTDEQLAEVKADMDATNEENIELIYDLTKYKLSYKPVLIEDEEGDTYSLRMEGGKCYIYYNERKEYYIKINEAKTGIQIFGVDRNDGTIDEEPGSAKKQ